MPHAELMGHARIKMTKVYAYPSLDSAKQAVSKLLTPYWSPEAQAEKSKKIG